MANTITSREVLPGWAVLYKAHGVIGLLILPFVNIGRMLQSLWSWKWKGWTRYSHAAIVLQDPETGGFWLFEDAEQGIIRTIILPGVLDGGFAVPLNFRFSAEQNRAMWDLAVSLLGESYSVLQLLAMIPFELSGEGLPAPRIGRVCSVLVATIWATGGCLLEESVYGVDPDDIPDLPFCLEPREVLG